MEQNFVSDGSPSADRLIAILNYFVSYPKQSFTVAEVVKSLKLSRATCHSFMVSLAEAGYLYRGSDRRYMLGPAILEIAHQAQTTFTPLDIARLEMKQLADRLDTVVAIHKREGDALVPQERAASARHLSLNYPPDLRHPLHPLGVLFFASQSDAEIDEMLNRASPPLSDEERALEWQLVSFARKEGYLVALEPTPEGRERRYRSGQIPVGDFLTKLSADETYRIQFVMAPIANKIGEVIFVVAVSGFNSAFTGDELNNMVEGILAACRHVEKFLSARR